MKHRLSLLTLLIFPILCASALGQEPTTNVPYYPADFSPSGDAQYVKERCTLDIHVPKGLAPGAPTVVWFHGGGLSAGNKFVPGPFRNQKFLVLAVNYRLFPRAKCEECVEDAAAAVAWAFGNVAKYGGDPEKIYVSGHSAGGYLAAMVALDPQYLGRFGLQNTRIAAALPISGQTTTHFQVVAQSEGRGKAGANNPLQITPMAPLFHTKKPVSDIHLLVGDPKLEWPARVEENYLLAAMLRTVPGHNVVEIRSYEGTDHGSVANPAYQYILELVNAAAGFPSGE